MNNKTCFIYKLGQSYAVKCNGFINNPEKIEKDFYLYRARNAFDYGPLVSRKDMFHVPFNKSENISSQRFNLPKVPCLYLADSSYVAKAEIGASGFTKCFVSAFKPSNELLSENIIDLTIPDGLGYVDSIERIRTLFKRIPAYFLNIACSIKSVDNGFETEKNKSEYVISQLVMESIEQIGCVGAAYNSNCIDCKSYILHSCFAFPAIKSASDNNLSEFLSKSFTMTYGLDYSYYFRKRSNELQDKDSTQFINNKNNYAKSFSDSSTDLFSTYYNGKNWACYEENLPYYKSTEFAFDEFLIHSMDFDFVNHELGEQTKLKFSFKK